MKKVYITRKKAILIAGIFAASLAAALIPKAVKVAKVHKHSSASF